MVMKEEAKTRYTVPVPSCDKFDVSRTTHDVMVTVPHEALNEEVLSDPSVVTDIGRFEWPPAYHTNPVVQRAGRPVLPLALYLDGAPVTRRDGAIGYWIYNLVLRRRHIIAVL